MRLEEPLPAARAGAHQVRRLPLVGCAVGMLADCLPGFRPHRTAARPGGGVGSGSRTGDFSAGDDLQFDGARWIMGDSEAGNAGRTRRTRTGADTPDWSRLHVGSCLGRAPRLRLRVGVRASSSLDPDSDPDPDPDPDPSPSPSPSPLRVLPYQLPQ